VSDIEQFDRKTTQINLILLLSKQGEVNISELGTGTRIDRKMAYSCLNYMADRGLVAVRRELSSGNTQKNEKRNYYLTYKGERVAEKLRELRATGVSE